MANLPLRDRGCRVDLTMRSIKELPFPIGFLAPAFILAVSFVVVILTGTDRALFLWLNQHLQALGGPILECITILGDGLVAIVIVLPLVRSRPEIAWNTLVSSLIVLILVQSLKHVFGSARPLEILPTDAFSVIGVPLRSGGFPSGHAATAFMVAGILALHFRLPWVRVALISAAVVVAASRIAVGVHWPTDSLAGAAIGWLSAGLGFRLTGRAHYMRQPVARISMQVLIAGGAISMLLYDHTSYPAGFRFQQLIAAVCLVIVLLQTLRDLRPLPHPQGLR